ncbi:MAG TPA: hypothetical protein IGS52_15500 [Oscillatoriaceae cyanobacterium M33_DOE_052]|uniref:Uncharacterized protein n=1 Tax=Planktothricoides sp. SpSt-374 TaxID=2282167 RepID=A0A7C3ZI42_9CYAN|nr:hypothetical protein [Oscillatoriaceae cyanobacterium M33_DOE_052]
MSVAWVCLKAFYPNLWIPGIGIFDDEVPIGQGGLGLIIPGLVMVLPARSHYRYGLHRNYTRGQEAQRLLPKPNSSRSAVLYNLTRVHDAGVSDSYSLER